jgi:hypothetical protein
MSYDSAKSRPVGFGLKPARILQRAQHRKKDGPSLRQNAYTYCNIPKDNSPKGLFLSYGNKSEVSVSSTSLTLDLPLKNRNEAEFLKRYVYMDDKS